MPGLGNIKKNISQKSSTYEHSKSDSLRLLQWESLNAASVDLGHEVALLQAAVLVGHRPAGDLLDVDLAPEHHAEVLLLLVPGQRHSNALLRRRRDAVQRRRRWQRRRKNDATLDDEADRLAGVSQHLDCGRVVDSLQGNAIGGDDSVIDSETKT